jgi:hypothetical protein
MLFCIVGVSFNLGWNDPQPLTIFLKFDVGIVQIYPITKHHSALMWWFVLQLGPKLYPYSNTQICNSICALIFLSFIVNELIYFILHYQTPLHMKPLDYFWMVPFHIYEQIQMQNYVWKFLPKLNIFFLNQLFNYKCRLEHSKGCGHPFTIHILCHGVI